ncbi:type III-B CRISPR module RAMP protein Cmr4 [uncultured Cohaesibacter sp.]|uniref:type III-B CRISPR module RAMP protein Cmr4 n=1 Tax=uncultured Cohaesibacter sp. TaxID=1002546 RepID=UPI002AA7A5D1|nr:type III-B CRISPR module RAMP protein Cmr4 [uncultured Cohaesibacter sp.]
MSNNKTKGAIVSLMAETHIHSGIGQSTGTLDLPVARERTTYYPFIPGSAVKGAFRVWADENERLKDKVDDLFGTKSQSVKDEAAVDGAGKLLFSDARLLLLPVRSLSDAFKWVTCPAILKRLERDINRSGKLYSFCIQPIEEGKYLGAGQHGSWLTLEEREFKCKNKIDVSIIKLLVPLTGETQAVIERRLVIIPDDDFTWYARFALPVMARNVLNEKTKISENLWYEESLAPDTVMYLLLGERKPDCISVVTDTLVENKAKYIQMGGNETVGQGWFHMRHFIGV